MNNTFNFKRFGKYFAYDLKSCWKEQRIFLLTLALLPVIFYVIYMIFIALNQGLSADVFGGSLPRPKIGLRVAELCIAVAIFIISLPSRAYGFITDKPRGSAWLMLPASRLEKFASMMLTCLVVLPVCFFCAYLLSDALICLIDPKCGQSIMSGWVHGVDPRNMTGLFNNEAFEVTLGGNGIWIVASIVLQWLSIFLLGALLFRKMKVSGTILALLVITIFAGYLISAGINAMGIEEFGYKVTAWTASHGDNIDLWINFWSNLGLAAVVIGCGTWSWFRIKRIQH